MAKKRKSKKASKKNEEVVVAKGLENTEAEETEAMEMLETEGDAALEAQAEEDVTPTEQVEMAPADLEPEEDEDDLEEECTFDLADRKRVIEAVLFVSDKSVGMSTLKAAFGREEGTFINNKHIKEAIESLEQEYEETNRGFRLITVDGGYQVRTAEDLKPYLQNTIKARSFRLTGPSLETLAMIAYKQPCTKSDIDEIRGVESSHLVRALMDRGLVAFAGKSELPGKPMLYKTTAKFLDIFGLRNLKELPSLSEIEALLPEGIGEEEEDKESLSDLTGKLSEQFEGEYSASEEELGKISDQLSSISTETDFFEQEKLRLKEQKEREKAESIREAIMVGEEVSTRDQNWLERYEAKLADAQEEEVNSEDTDETVDSSEIISPESEDLEAAELAESFDDETSKMEAESSLDDETELDEETGEEPSEMENSEEILETSELNDEEEIDEEVLENDELPPLNENF